MSYISKKAIEKDRNIEEYEITENNFINIKLNLNKFVDIGINFKIFEIKKSKGDNP